MSQTISILLTLVGIMIISYWIVYFLMGHLSQGLRTIESGGYFAFHILAEIITAILCVIGGVWMVLSLNEGNLIS